MTSQVTFSLREGAGLLTFLSVGGGEKERDVLGGEAVGQRFIAAVGFLQPIKGRGRNLTCEETGSVIQSEIRKELLHQETQNCGTIRTKNPAPVLRFASFSMFSPSFLAFSK